LGERADQRTTLTGLCERLDGFRRVAARYGESAELERIVAALRSDGEAPGPLEAARELLRRCGIPDALRGVPDLPLGGGQPLEEAYLCPLPQGRRCLRTVLAVEAGGSEPYCGIHRVPLALTEF
jgi:hypothetical protein